jgi:hypothetical protein
VQLRVYCVPSPSPAQAVVTPPAVTLEVEPVIWAGVSAALVVTLKRRVPVLVGHTSSDTGAVVMVSWSRAGGVTFTVVVPVQAVGRRGMEQG